MMRRSALLMCLVLAGCGDGELDDLKQYVKATGEQYRGRIPPLPEAKPYEPFTYEAFDLPDPFKPRKLATAAGGGKQPDLNRRREPLEAFPLDNLRFVGTIQKDKLSYALIKAPDNVLHRIKIGNYLGQNYGMVSEITENQIKLIELVQDSVGDWTEKESFLPLAEDAPSEQKK